MEKISTVGLDLAKRVFQVHGVDAAGTVVVRRQLRRGEVLKFFTRLEPCLVGMEACSSAHYWGQQLQALGHTVRLMPPKYVKAYVKRGKSDAADAEAICEAAGRPSMRFVPVKSREEQAVLVLHRTRELLIRQRTRLANALRGHLAEFGIIAAQGKAALLKCMAALDEGAVPALARLALEELRGEIATVNRRIAKLEAEILALHRANPASRRLATIPGIGPITASAIVAVIGNGAQFHSGRHLAAWIGLVPKNDSTGGKERLGPISKMGSRDLRRLLVIGATSLLRQRKAVSAHAVWLRKLAARKPPRLATIALANKTARIVWALLAHGGVYDDAHARVA